ncbi:hypothetical protein FQN57_002444, partial [Myotisia sp. PD_48]
MSNLDPELYTVAWLAPLEIEARAALHMLDNKHSGRFALGPGDDYVFQAGDMCGHNIIIATLPAGQEYGTGSAAALASQVKKFFPNLWFGLLVGVAAGLPNLSRTPPIDIRLGDVLVGLPKGESAGLIAYDLGKELGNDGFQLLHFGHVLANTETVVESAIGSIRLRAPDDTEAFLPYYENIRLKNHGSGTFVDPGQEYDKLYEVDDDGIEAMIQRELRPIDKRSRVWYGPIGSGEKLMKNARKRNELRDTYNIIGLEMEAAGMMNRIPVGVIRGVCDYGDQHKNKEWQPYAAAMAAAYAKAILYEISPKILQGKQVSAHNKSSECNVNTEPRSQEAKECLQNLVLTDPEEDKNALKRRKGNRAPGTCDWILDTNEIQEWLGATDRPVQTRSNILWLHGLPGIGKSTMAITLVEGLSTIFSSICDKTLAYYFFDSTSEDRNTSIAMLRGLIYQLVQQHPQLLKFLESKYSERKEKIFTSFDALWNIFLSIASDQATGEKYVVIDALDECSQESRDMLLKQLQQTFKNESKAPLNIQILFTSRPYPEIREDLQQFRNKDLASFDNAKRDISIFIDQKVDELKAKKRYTSKIVTEVRQILRDKAEGTFLWVGIACEELSRCSSKNAVKILRNLPTGLYSLYETLFKAALDRDEEERQGIIRILNFVVISQRPLDLLELSIACQLHKEQAHEERLEFTRDDIELCRLMIIVQDDKVFLLHKSVKDFLTTFDNGRYINESKSHADFAYRCIDHFLGYSNGDNQNNIRSNDRFFEYSVEFWVNHAHAAGSEFVVKDAYVKFFDFNSESRENWLQQYTSMHLFPRISQQYSIFHVAARWGIIALANHILNKRNRKNDQEQDMTIEFDDAELWTEELGTPLTEAARAGHEEILSFLIYKADKDVKILECVTIAAAGNTRNGEKIMALLLDRRGDQVTITEEVVKAAARNWNGEEIMTLLLDRRGDQVTITEEVVKAAARNWNGEKIMTLLLDRRGDQ